MCLSVTNSFLLTNKVKDKKYIEHFYDNPIYIFIIPINTLDIKRMRILDHAQIAYGT